MKQYKITHEDDNEHPVSFTITATDQVDAYKKAVKHIADKIYPDLTESQIEQWDEVYDEITIEPVKQPTQQERENTFNAFLKRWRSA
jgi:hypothetical protein